MSDHRAGVRWRRTTPGFTYEEYDRSHEMLLAGRTIAASASVAYRGHEDRVDPEEAFVAAIASCHMLSFLAIAARKRIVVDAYEDDAVGFLEKNPRGKLSVTRAVLRPRVRFAPGHEPAAEALTWLHALAHSECFIANSVATEITIEA